LKKSKEQQHNTHTHTHTNMSESKESIYGEVSIANPKFHLRKNGKVQTKKTPDFEDVAVWTSSSSAEWQAGLEDGTAGRRSKKVCYMNKGAWVEQILDMHTVVPGAFYTIRLDATRSAEKADRVLVQVYLGDE
jgi:hypothetical protein